MQSEVSLFPEGITVRSGGYILKFANGFDLGDLRTFSLRFSVNAPPEVVEFVRVLNLENRYLPLNDSPISLPYSSSTEEKIDADGNIKAGISLSESFLPVSVKESFNEIRQKSLIGLSKTFGALMFANNNWQVSAQYLAIYWGHSKTGKKHILPHPEEEFAFSPAYPPPPNFKVDSGRTNSFEFS